MLLLSPRWQQHTVALSLEPLERRVSLYGISARLRGRPVLRQNTPNHWRPQSWGYFVVAPRCEARFHYAMLAK